MATTLAASPAPSVDIPEGVWEEAAWLPCRLGVEVAVQGFTVGDLLSLEIGALVDTGIATDADVAVSVNGAPVGSGKLDRAGERRGVRLTELS